VDPGLGYGVSGHSHSFTGVIGHSDKQTGVYGYAGAGVAPLALANVAVYGSSPTGRGGVFKGGTAQLRLVPSAAVGHPTKGQSGDLFVDSSGHLWFCKTGGNPAVWKQVSLV
jgi:hypothetical protein